MPIGTRYVFIASMDVDPEKEDLFNEVYDTEHVPYLLEVPGVIAVTRLEAQDFEVSMGGELRSVPRGETPTWHAIYEIESPDVLKSEAWAEAVERGRWPGEVRPTPATAGIRSSGLWVGRGASCPGRRAISRKPATAREPAPAVGQGTPGRFVHAGRPLPSFPVAPEAGIHESRGGRGNFHTMGNGSPVPTTDVLVRE